MSNIKKRKTKPATASHPATISLTWKQAAEMQKADRQAARLKILEEMMAMSASSDASFPRLNDQISSSGS